MSASIRFGLVGDPPRGTQATEPLTSNPGAVVAPILLLPTLVWPLLEFGSFQEACHR